MLSIERNTSKYKEGRLSSSFYTPHGDIRTLLRSNVNFKTGNEIVDI